MAFDVDATEAGVAVSLAAWKLYPYEGIVSIVLGAEEDESEVEVEVDTLDVLVTLDVELGWDVAEAA